MTALNYQGLGFSLIGFISVFAGCQRGPEMGNVSGKITFHGAPVTQGTVLLFPDKGPAAVGHLDEQGEFIMRTNGETGVFVGSSQVAITPPTDVAVIGMPKYPGAPPNIRFDNIPSRFRSANTSQVRFQVNTGDNRLEMDLASPNTNRGGRVPQ